MPSLDAIALRQREWDAIIVGSGMGGGTLGYALAKSGRSVLFIEKGRSTLGAGDVVRGGLPEMFFDEAMIADPDRRRDMLTRAGRCVDQVLDIEGKSREFVPFIGSGAGGSSALYGMVCERFFPSDFTPRQNHARLDDSTVPDAWPISYADFEPWYADAERLYRVHGAADPCRPWSDGDALLPSPPFTPSGAELADLFQSRGLHPYPLHVACEFLPDCESCQSYLCPRECKNDATRMCLRPAVNDHGAHFLDQCDVIALEATRTKVEGVVCRRQGETFTLRGRVIALAAGALATPGILLGSTSPDWPQGLANAHDQVGRNVMRHCIDLYVLFPKTKEPIVGQVKELAFNDFYQVDGWKLGTVQSAGATPPIEVLINQPGWINWLLRRGRGPLGRLWEGFRLHTSALAAIMEDLPYADNRVRRSDSATAPYRLEYRFRPADQARATEFRRRMKAALGKTRNIHLKAGADNKPIAHVCGGCRFGDDPRTSVLDRDCRAHGVDNLFVVDSSFFPSSGGINPSLTIAANALRVAKAIDARF